MAETEPNRTRRRVIIGAVVILVIILILLLLKFCQAPPLRQVETRRGEGRLVTLQLGDLIATGFSGFITTDPEAETPDEADPDTRFIDLQGPSARIFDISDPGFVWDGRFWSPPVRATASAGEIGQVFAIVTDDARRPNIYFAATSAYGLNLVVQPDPHEAPERVPTGRDGAFWMPGQFGPGGGPGTIWRVDGRTGRITRFADVQLNGRATGPASLGGLAYDRRHNQIFVSDLSTGMIHRLGLDGVEAERFDHGVTGRRRAGLGTVAHEARELPSPSDPDFDTRDPDSWGFTPPDRRVTALRVWGERLYYAVEGSDQIWSVGIRRDDPDTQAYEGGEFLGDARAELDLPGMPDDTRITAIEFNAHGDMIVAERGLSSGAFGLQNLTSGSEARVRRFWREDPDIAVTPGRWSPQPEEHAIGYAGDHRNAGGGVTLGYGYDADGTIVFNRCEASIWTSGESLRGFDRTPDGFEPDGPLQVHGIQGAPADWARPFNTPPVASYFTDFDDRLGDAPRRGHSGAVAIYRLPCGEGSRVAAGGGGVILPPGTTITPPASPPGTTGGGSNTGGTTNNTTNINNTTNTNTSITDIDINNWLNVDIYICEVVCTGPDCVNGPGGGSSQCMAVIGEFQCDADTGEWVFNAAVDDIAGAGIDAIRAYSHTPGVSLVNGPEIAMTPMPGQMAFDGLSPGESVVVEMCGFNSADESSGQPYDCCWQTQVLTAPTEACPIP